MDWYDEEYFPKKDDFENSFEFGEAVYSSILDRFSYERGGSVKEEFRKTSQAYSHLYAWANWNDVLVIQDDDFPFAIDVPFDEPSEHIISTHTNKLTSILQSQGWARVESSYCFSESGLKGANNLLVYQKGRRYDDHIIPGLAEILDTIGADRVLSSTALNRFVCQRLKSLNLDECADDDVTSAYVAAIETRLDDYNWIDIESHTQPDRLWIEPDELFEYLINEFENSNSVSDSEFRKEIELFISSENPGAKEGAAFDLSIFLTPLFKRIRSLGWNEVIVDERTTWYKSEDDQKEALDEILDEFREVIEHPSRFDYETYGFRNEAYKFVRENEHSILNHGFYDKEFLDRQMRRLEYYAEVDEEFKRMEGAKVADGTWEFVPSSE